LVAAGSGIAPFRSFWQQKAFELEEFGQVSPMNLFFGCKDEESDFLRNETDLLVLML
jgi:sulfite reductase alpha subunit-like flavoprotein